MIKEIIWNYQVLKVCPASVFIAGAVSRYGLKATSACGDIPGPVLLGR